MISSDHTQFLIQDEVDQIISTFYLVCESKIIKIHQRRSNFSTTLALLMYLLKLIET